jgi:hypothetical protein
VGDVWGGCRLTTVQLPEGGSVTVKAGGIGRAVIGKLVSTNDLSDCDLTLTPLLPAIPYPDGLDAAAKQDWVNKWFWSNAAENYRIWYRGTPQVESRFFGGSWPVKIGADGSFQIDDVPAGDYELVATFLAGQQGRARPGPISFDQTGIISKKFTMPDGDNLTALPALDLGAVGESGVNNAKTEEAAAKITVAEPSAHEPVTVGMASDRAAIRPGELFDLVVQVRIAEGHHIYPEWTSPSNTFAATKVNLALPEGITALSDWSFPPPVRTGSDWVYTNKIVLQRSFKVRSDVPAGALSIKGALRCQACNDQLCWPAKDLPLAATIQVGNPTKGNP